MLHFHNVCPICKSELLHFTNVGKKCPTLERDHFSFIEWRCNRDKFTQITDLYKNLLVEMVTLKDTIVEVNYVLHKTIIYYGKKDSMELKNRLIDLDYPELIKTHSKVKTLLLFS